ncbi:FAD-binding oxidoreductase [Actinocorallia sp. A-T 12471]|uniref:NAD(P)/FAD-dependent oxidoreductase n=1 Tax=Actinocorallia sp. A-T 12471 TaxID=3089813 RepID=UPI0029CE7604|nr:FAD-binding oxidoreductase [Actinocorallia sp. A-T 12471]MDX6740031.1 FAD-binding oxidoreductase [Actinocorallia sp. A-T 12471]
MSADVVIVGGGLEGVAAARCLAGRGVSVTVLERATIGSGGTGKSSGIVRCHYGVPSLAAMAWKGTELFENAQDVLGQDVGFRRTGYVVGVGAQNAAALRANLEMHKGLGIDVREIGHDEVKEMWPAAYTDDFAAFGYEPYGGYGDAYSTAQAFAAAARRDGAVIRQGAEVASIVAESGKVTGVLLADGEFVAADVVVLAAGPWSVALAAPLGLALPIRAMREQIMLIDPGEHLGDIPVLSDLVSLQYVRAETGGKLLFGNSDLSEPEWADPDAYRNRAETSFMERTAARLEHRFPGLINAGFTGGYAGCYDVTPDFNPIIGPAGPDGLVVAAGFSGHGFKISPAVGELVADLVIEGDSLDPQVPAADFRFTRFAEESPLTSTNPYIGAGEMR